MPPKKKTEMQKLREKLKKQKQKIEKPVIIPGAEKPEYPAAKTAKDRKKANKEEEAVREFFAGLEVIDDGDIVMEIEKFAKGPNAPAGRSRFFEKFVNLLPETYFKEFARTYVAQEGRKLEDYWKYFVERPTVALAIQKNMKNIEEQQRLDLEEKKRLKNIQKKLFGEMSDDSSISIGSTPVIPDKSPQPPVMVAVDSKGNLTQIKSKTTPTPKKSRPIFNEECIDAYITMPWINARVDGIYISPVAGTDITPFVIAGITEENNGVIWHKTNASFSKLLCNAHFRSRTQDGDVHTAYTKRGEPVRMKIAYKTNRGFIVQDEAIFNAEKEYINEKSMTEEQHLQKTLAGPVTNEIEQIGMKELSRVLHSVAPDIRDYGQVDKYDTAYNMKAIETISNSTRTVKEFFTKLADVLIYLETDDLGHEIFRKRVREEYYLPEILVNLSPSEKLPEFFDDPRVEQEKRDILARRLHNNIRNFVHRMALLVYRTRDPTKRVRNIGRAPMIKVIPRVEEWKSVCVNREDVINEPDDQIIYYKEDDQVYCLIIRDIMQQIAVEDEPKNPYSGKPLNKGFVERFGQLYNLDLKRKGYGNNLTPKKTTPTPPKTPTPTPTPTLAPGLLNMIVNNIKECETEINEGKLGEDGKCPGIEGESDSDESINEVVSGSNETSDLDALLDSDSPEFSPKRETPKGQFISGNVCQQCKKKIDPEKALKTKIDLDKFETAYFCCFKCFEKYDAWPRNKSKKHKNKSNGKRGRNGTKERNSKKSKK